MYNLQTQWSYLKTKWKQHKKGYIAVNELLYSHISWRQNNLNEIKYQIKCEGKGSKIHVICRPDLIVHRPGKSYSGKMFCLKISESIQMKNACRQYEWNLNN